MNGIAPIENGLVSSRATSRPAASTTAKFASLPVADRVRRRADPAHRPFALERVRVHARADGPRLAFDLELRLVRLVADQVELLEPRLEAELPERVGDDVGGARSLVGPRLARADVDGECLDQVHEAESRPAVTEYDHRVRPRPARLQRLPPQYFVALLGRVAAAAAEAGPPLVDLGRGNPELGPPAHVVEALVESARRSDVHGYAPIRGLARTREAIARALPRRLRRRARSGARGRSRFPGRRPASSSSRSCSPTRATPSSCPIRTTPTTRPAPRSPARASRRSRSIPTQAGRPHLDDVDGAAALYLNYPSNPCAVCAPDGVFADAVRWAERTGGAVVHDAAYIDLVYDGRAPESFLATPGAKDVGVEMWSMSKTYGMAGWRIGFVVGNAEIVERINLLNDHERVGIFEPMQRATIAALEGPQESVAERVATYERRRDRLAGALDTPIVCEGTFFVWLRLPEGLTAERLLEEHRVAVAPGEGFGPSGAGWARISLAVADDVLELGAERLAEAFAGAIA